jgi:chromosome partitioning protein
MFLTMCYKLCKPIKGAISMSLSQQMGEHIKAAQTWMSDRAKEKFGGDSPQQRVLKRRFGINEAAELCGVTSESIRKAESAGRLPTPDYKDSKAQRPIRAGYTLNQIEHMRSVFNTHPWRPEHLEAITVSVPGGKGGSWKTATTAHFAQWLSLKGYRILLVDIDPQAHASMYFGFHPEINVSEADTILPFMLGEKDDLSYCVKETSWPNLDVIPSNLQLQRIESELHNAEIEYQPHQMLQAGIDGVKDHYDIVLIDGHPDLGIGTTNMICASDVVLIATSAETNDINSTCQLMGLIKDIYHEDDGLDVSHEPYVRVLPTKLGAPNSSSLKNLSEMKIFWAGLPVEAGVHFTDEVGKGQRRMATIYEQADSSERSSPTAWKRATEIFDATYNEILNDIIKPMWKEED